MRIIGAKAGPTYRVEIERDADGFLAQFHRARRIPVETDIDAPVSLGGTVGRTSSHRPGRAAVALEE